MDAGQSINTIRDALSEVRDGNVGATYTKEQLIVRATRAKTELSQAEFAEAINTPARTLQEWEQGRATPPGVALKLCELVLSEPDLLRA